MQRPTPSPLCTNWDGEMVETAQPTRVSITSSSYSFSDHTHDLNRHSNSLSLSLSSTLSPSRSYSALSSTPSSSVPLPTTPDDLSYSGIEFPTTETSKHHFPRSWEQTPHTVAGYSLLPQPSPAPFMAGHELPIDIMASHHNQYNSYYQYGMSPAHTAGNMSQSSLASDECSHNQLGLQGVPPAAVTYTDYDGNQSSANSQLGFTPSDMHATTPLRCTAPFQDWSTPDEAFSGSGELPIIQSIDPATIQPNASPFTASNTSIDPDSPHIASDGKRSPTPNDKPWYNGASNWIKDVELHQREKIHQYHFKPSDWKKSDTIPKPLSPINEDCKADYTQLMEIEGARPPMSEAQAIDALMKKSQEDLNAPADKKSKAAAAGRPRRPMNSAFCFMFWRRGQWGQMFPGMSTGQISGWLSAEWSAIKTLRKEEYRWWTNLAGNYARKFNSVFEDYKYTRAPNGQGRGGRSKARKLAREGLGPYPASIDNRNTLKRSGRKSDSHPFSSHIDQALQPEYVPQYQDFPTGIHTPFAGSYGGLPATTSHPQPSGSLGYDSGYSSPHPTAGLALESSQGYTAYHIGPAQTPYEQHAPIEYFQPGHPSMPLSYHEAPVYSAAGVMSASQNTVPRQMRPYEFPGDVRYIARDAAHGPPTYMVPAEHYTV